jgi:hypothetical protein
VDLSNRWQCFFKDNQVKQPGDGADPSCYCTWQQVWPGSAMQQGKQQQWKQLAASTPQQGLLAQPMLAADDNIKCSNSSQNSSG